MLQFTQPLTTGNRLLVAVVAVAVAASIAISDVHAATISVALPIPLPKSLMDGHTTCNPKLVYYWGQNSYGVKHGKDKANWEKPLAYYCRTKQVSNIVISFMHVFGKEKPQVDFSSHCDSSRVFPGTKIIDCPELREDVKVCQGLGVKVELSLGGATGRYGFANDKQAIAFATELYNMAFGGKGSVRPFGPNSLDGVNLDIENAHSTSYATFVKQLRKLQGKRSLLVSAAPQCPYPDASLHDALIKAEIDSVYVQFYNNYCGMQVYGTKNFNFNTWVKWSQTLAKRRGAKVYLGIAGSAESAGSGYVPAERIQTAIKLLAREYPTVFGGVAIWDASTAYMNKVGDSNFATAVQNTLEEVCRK
ncbi:glycoside hydrolase superfamily [Syncephalis plumigaleata]|nr:glycoside hydrolase superfamily [Syncephalis plumigaleata]